MSSTVSASVTKLESQPEASGGRSSPVTLKLRKPKAEKKVSWTTATVDNEHMNKKKSKCCCIYEKPKEFGESDTESDDDCDHCNGHVEAKKNPKPKRSDGKKDSSDDEST